MASSRGSFERGSKVVDRLRTERKVDTESGGPATVAHQSARSPHLIMQTRMYRRTP